MKIGILTEGGKGIGFGHLMRCIAIYNKLVSLDLEIEFIYQGDESADEFVKNHLDNSSNLDWHNDLKYCLETKLSGVFGIIVDSYLCSLEIYEKLYSYVKKGLLIIDDYKRLDYPGGIVVNPSIYGEQLDYPDNNDIEYLLGKEYIILRPEFVEINPNDIKEHIKSVLITFGGMLHYELMEYLKSRINKKFGFEIDTIEPHKRMKSIEEMIELMRKNDICISGGGQTLHELARIGLPTIGICLAENQVMNLKGLQKEGFLEYVGWFDEESVIDKTIDAIEKLKSYEERKKRSSLGRQSIDGSGVERIAERFVGVL